MSEYRIEDCEAWALRFLQILRSRGLTTGKLIKIVPRPPNRVIGGVRMPPSFEMAWPSPPWFYHLAVRHSGRMYDEMFPNGLPQEQYEDRFEYRDFLEFLEVPTE